jgi:hypothetical protein
MIWRVWMASSISLVSLGFLGRLVRSTSSTRVAISSDPEGVGRPMLNEEMSSGLVDDTEKARAQSR